MIYLVILFMVAAYIIQHPTFKGYVSESKIRYYLHKLDIDENYIVLHDVILPTADGKTAQIDHIILSVYGIFVIETTNDKGFIYGDDKKKYWTKVILNKQVRLLSPVFKNYRNISSLERLLGCQPFISIVTFNTKANLKDIFITEDYLHVTHDWRILKVIQQYQEQVIPHEELVRMENMILKNMISERGVIKRIRLEKNESASKLGVDACLVCGRRRNEDASFRCSNHPACSYAEKA